MIFFTADHHFGHRAIIDYAGRPFESVEVMDETLIGTWNARVGPKDEVYHLGDVSLCRTARTKEILSRLNGRIYLIRGNHDKSLKGAVLDRFVWVKNYHELSYEGAGIRVKGAHATKIVLSHYAFRVWNKSHFGSWNLYGHSHGSLPELPDTRQLDVGVDTRDDYAPYSLEEVEAILSKRRFKGVDRHVGPERKARAVEIKDAMAEIKAKMGDGA
jgi:calcineurin-like phosphoesterase family protein